MLRCRGVQSSAHIRVVAMPAHKDGVPVLNVATESWSTLSWACVSVSCLCPRFSNVQTLAQRATSHRRGQATHTVERQLVRFSLTRCSARKQYRCKQAQRGTEYVVVVWYALVESSSTGCHLASHCFRNKQPGQTAKSTPVQSALTCTTTYT